MVETAIAARLTDLMSKRSFALALGNLLAVALLGCVMPAVEKISSVFEGGGRVDLWRQQLPGGRGELLARWHEGCAVTVSSLRAATQNFQ